MFVCIEMYICLVFYIFSGLLGSGWFGCLFVLMYCKECGSGVAKGGHGRAFAQPSQFLAQPSQTFAQPSQVA